ncbi:MAG TPA: PAS domain S-box protein, partial [Dehalococcoidia bacterium]
MAIDKVVRTSDRDKRWSGLNPLYSARGRIILGFSLLVLILAAVAFASALQVRKHQSDASAMQEHASTTYQIQEVLVNVEATAAALQRYVAVGDDALVAGDETLVQEIRSFYTAGMAAIQQATAQEEERGDDLEAARLQLISSQAASLIEGVEQIIELRQDGDAEEAAAALEGAVFPFRLFEDSLREAAAHEAEELAELRDRAERTGDIAFWLLVISGAAGAALGLAAAALIAHSIIKPLSSLEATAAAISEGDLKARAQTTGPRELARLGTSLNTMTESLLDASKRRELEEAIVLRERHFRSLIENAVDLVIVLNDDSTIRYISPSVKRAIGFAPEELVGSSAFSGMVHEDDLANSIAAFKEVTQNPDVTSPMTARVRHKNGSWRAFEGTLQNLRDDPAVAGMVL